MEGDMEIAVWLSIILVIVGAHVIISLAYADSENHVTITVDAKDIKYNNGDEKYLIHSTSGEVFEITDTYMFWRFNSSDTYFSLHEGVSYNCTVAGWRVPFLSWYRNILTAVPSV